MTQIQKGQKLKGTLFIVGELVCIGGIAISQSKKSDWENKMKTTKNVQQLKSYSDEANTCKNIGAICVAGAAGLYVWNVIDGLVSKGKIHTYLAGRRVDLKLAPYATAVESGLTMNITFQATAYETITYPIILSPVVCRLQRLHNLRRFQHHIGDCCRR